MAAVDDGAKGMAAVARCQTLVALAPLVRAAVAGAAEGGGGRHHLAAAAAAVLRTGVELALDLEPKDSAVDEEVRARERLARPHLTAQVAAGREGVLPCPSGGRKACRDWAQRAEFGIGAEQVPTTAREAGRRARGPRRRADASSEEEGKEEVVLDPVPPFPSVLGPLGGALGEETRARLEAAAGAAAEASAAIAEAEGRARARAEERDRLALALAEAERRLQDRAEERDRLALALEDVRRRYAAAPAKLVGPSVDEPKSDVAEADAAMEPTLVPADVEGEEFQGIDHALDLSDGPSSPNSPRDVVGQGSGEEVLRETVEVAQLLVNDGGMGFNGAFGALDVHLADLAVGDRVEVIKSFVPLRQVRHVPIGVRGVVGHAGGELDMQGAVASVVWDVPRLTRIGGSSIGGASKSQQHWRCFRKLADGDA
ncbi:unnamed protein product [Prorocentrum cordatum]|uniref:Uncharacterized protein n=1 Tax=Prorocentrum cordatum TaxID=2364126 RepID=A0ABN9XHR4_9DINO|nr:unnamed protein product [Polarella glacialis]